jgi:hypothetical protein
MKGHGVGALLGALFLTACATSYVTPGPGASLTHFAGADASITEVMAREPAAAFPARIATARLQGSGYASRGAACHGGGRYCVATARDVEPDSAFVRLNALPMVAGVAPVNRILLPDNLGSVDDLRSVAAALRADILLVYSLDTRFSLGGSDIGPLQLVSLGLFRTESAKVTTTASAALFDVRTGFLYGVAEATAQEEQRSTIWGTEQVLETVRRETEARSFEALVDEIEVLWSSVLSVHAAPGA